MLGEATLGEARLGEAMLGEALLGEAPKLSKLVCLDFFGVDSAISAKIAADRYISANLALMSH